MRMAHELLPFLDKEEQKAKAKSKEPKDLEAFMNEERSAIANNAAPADEAYSNFIRNLHRLQASVLRTSNFKMRFLRSGLTVSS